MGLICQWSDVVLLLFPKCPMGRSASKATLPVPVGTASPACGCAMVRKTVKMELMNSSVVNQTSPLPVLGSAPAQ